MNISLDESCEGRLQGTEWQMKEMDGWRRANWGKEKEMDFAREVKRETLLQESRRKHSRTQSWAEIVETG